MNKDSNRFGKDEGAAKNKRMVGFLAIIFLVGGLQVAAQYFAYQFNDQPQLGAHFNYIYDEPWAILVWADKWYDQYPAIFDMAASF